MKVKNNDFLIWLCVAVGAGQTSSSLHAADMQIAIPASGTLQCELAYRHMIPKAPESRAFVMVTSANCGFKGLSSTVKHIYTMSLDFDENGVGRLLSGSGVSLVEHKPVNSILMKEAEYVLEIDKGSVTGWHATGELQWTSGTHSGKTASWKAQATGPDTLLIDYATTDRE